MKPTKKRNETLDLLIELVEGMVQEEGFKTLRFSDTDRLGTTAYDCLILRDANGKEYSIDFDESMTRDIDKMVWESTNYIRESEDE